MYIKRVHIENIRSLAELNWEITPDKAAGWHVIIGDNGAGKSSFVCSIALALIGPAEAFALRQDWNGWLRSGQSSGRIQLNLLYDKNVDLISPSDEEQDPTLPPMNPVFTDMHAQAVRVAQDKVYAFPSVTLLFKRQNNNGVVLGWEQPSGRYDPFMHIWGENPGWFSASYGPFRRFTGGDNEYEEVVRSNPKPLRHLTLFGENVALPESLRWLQELKFKQLENDEEGDLLDMVTNFVNQDDFLPYGVRLNNVSSKGVEFIDGNGCRVPVEELSDGYRSILSMTFELIRQLARTYGSQKVFDRKAPDKVAVPGVVLIDEVDAHLHPTWQRRVGLWFRKYFPKMQFIVTTHSPLVCQAASHGTVYRLPDPSSEEPARMVTDIELDRLLYGNILDAYSTEAFGSNVTRSDESKRLLKRLAELNRKQLRGQLTESERREQMELRATLPTTAHIIDEEVVK